MKKHTLCILAGASALTTAVPLFVLTPGKSSRRQKAPFYRHNFAHRGLHTEDKSIPENSLPAFDLAVSNGYGIELDVQLSADGHVVVFHDDTLKRVCGVDAAVSDKTLEELQTLSLCGTEYTIPLFTQVLDVVDGRGPLIVELKSGTRNRELCRKTYEILQGYTGDVCVESFNPLMVAWFRFHGKDLLRGQLASPYRPGKTRKDSLSSWILSRTLLNFLARPQFIAYKIGKAPLGVRLSYYLGAMRIGWTSHDRESEKDRDAVIFEFYRPEPTYNKE